MAWVFLNATRLRSGWRLLGLALLLAGGSVAAGLLRPGILRAFPGGLPPHATMAAPGGVPGFILLLAALGLPAMVAVRLLDQRPLESLGWHRHRGVSRDLLFGGVVGGGSALLIYTLPLALGEVALASAPDLPAGGGSRWMAAGWLAVALALRETLLRGCLLASMVEGIGGEAAVLVSAVVGGSVLLAWHLITLARLPPWPAIVCVLAEGVLLGQSMRRTRSLWLSWALSLGWYGMLGVALGLPILGVRVAPTPAAALTAQALVAADELGPMSALPATGGWLLALVAVLLFGPTPDAWTAELWDRHVRGSRPRGRR